MTTDEVRLKSPLPCWHESLASARTDPMVTLCAEGGHVQTDRPVPAGTPLFVELSLGQSLGAEKTEIDAVAESGRDAATVGFFVRFLRVDARARAWIDALVRERMEEDRRAYAKGPAAPLDELTPVPIDVEAPIELTADGAPPVAADLDFDDPTRDPALALNAPPTAAPAPAPAAPTPASPPTASRPPIAAPPIAAQPPVAPTPPPIAAAPPVAPTPPPIAAAPPVAPTPPPAAITPPARSVTPMAWDSNADADSTQRWAVAPPVAAPVVPATPAVLSLPDLAPAPVAPPRVLDVDVTQPWARAGFDSIPPRPLPAPDADGAHETTRPWARAAIAPPPMEPDPNAPPAIAAPVAPPPVAPPPSAPAAIAPNPSVPLPRIITPPLLAALPPQPTADEVAPAAAPPRIPTPSMTHVAPEKASEKAASFGANPMPRMASLDVPGGIPPPHSFSETMRWPTAQLRVADAPLEMPMVASPAAPPPEPDAFVPASDDGDAGLAAMFDAPAEVTDAPRLEMAETPTRADSPFGDTGGFLGDSDEDIAAGGNGALDFGLEVTDPGEVPSDDAPPAIATLEDDGPPSEPFSFGLAPDRAEPPDGALDVDLEVAATEEGAPPDDAIELLDAELSDIDDVLGAPVPAPAPPAVVPPAAPAFPAITPLPQPALAHALSPTASPSLAPAFTPSASRNPFEALVSAAPMPRTVTPPVATVHTQPFFPAAAVAAALAEPPPPPWTQAPEPTRTTDPLFPAYTGPAPTPAPSPARSLSPPPLAKPAPLAPPPTQAPATLMFAAADVHAAVDAARSPPPQGPPQGAAIASGAMLGNDANVAGVPLEIAAQMPGDAELELAFELADPPARATAHEPASWELRPPAAAEALAEEDDLPLVVGHDTDLPVVVGASSMPPESWIVPADKKPR